MALFCIHRLFPYLRNIGAVSLCSRNLFDWIVLKIKCVSGRGVYETFEIVPKSSCVSGGGVDETSLRLSLSQVVCQVGALMRCL